MVGGRYTVGLVTVHVCVCVCVYVRLSMLLFWRGEIDGNEGGMGKRERVRNSRDNTTERRERESEEHKR